MPTIVSCFLPQIGQRFDQARDLINTANAEEFRGNKMAASRSLRRAAELYTEASAMCHFNAGILYTLDKANDVATQKTDDVSTVDHEP